MKKFFMILGGIFGVILVIAGIAAAILIPAALRLDKDVTAYIQNAVPKIVTNWNIQELVNRASPQLNSTVAARGGYDRIFEMFQRLGSFKQLGTPKGMVGTSTFTGEGTATVGNYTVPAEFEKGHATIQIQLLRVNDTWQINGFYIHSDVFLQPVPAKEPQSAKKKASTARKHSW